MYYHIKRSIITEEGEEGRRMVAPAPPPPPGPAPPRLKETIRRCHSPLENRVNFDIIGSGIIYDINCHIIDWLSLPVSFSPSLLAERASSA